MGAKNAEIEANKNQTQGEKGPEHKLNFRESCGEKRTHFQGGSDGRRL
jgi:hypothetical protein